MDRLLEQCEALIKCIVQAPDQYSPANLIKRDPKIGSLAKAVEQDLHTCAEVFSPKKQTPLNGQREFRAVCWNIERGKNFGAVLQTLKEHPQMKAADFYLLTEVDCGMSRSGNRHIPKDLGEALGYYAYFSPSYFNFTNGHGVERYNEGQNRWGLHGKALLSRYPLSETHCIPMPNATDKLRSKEARLGQKRALVGKLSVADKTLTLVCTHLDAFSSPKTRSEQLAAAVTACADSSHVLLGGDWNTNTLNSTSTWSLIPSVMRQLTMVGPKKMVQKHHPYPERRFDRPLFNMLEDLGLDFRSCNLLGEPTYDLLSDDQELGEMASDQYPDWALKFINRLIHKTGGRIGLKLDWFAAKNLKILENKVIGSKEIRLPGLETRPSDHHPIVTHFQLEA